MPDDTQRFGDLLIDMGLVTEAQVHEALAVQGLTHHRLGEALISLGYLTRSQLQRALATALGKHPVTVSERAALGDILVGLKYVTPHQLDEARREQQKSAGELGEVLVRLGFCTPQQVYEAMGLQRSMASEQAMHQANGARLAANGLKVMVVDDSPLACRLIEEGLGVMGYEVEAFDDPLKALAAFEALKPHLVLTDLEMPGIDGAELCRRLKETSRRSVPVIILTANDADAQRVTGLRAGADDYVHKGASMDELTARMESIMRRTQETERMRRLFARYTSEEVVEEILKSGEVNLTGEKREVTVLFADIRSFTSVSESVPPEQVMAMLNHVLGEMADAVLASQGTLDKFLGDGLMAVFGAPVHHEDDARRAVDAALSMLEAVRLRNELPGMRTLEVGIGINSGTVVAGSLGNSRRTEYTVVGDVVNVAARLCALAGPGEILVGERTVRLLGDTSQFEELAPVRLKGKTQPVPLFRVTPETVEVRVAGNARS
ncbi:MAG: response regulator [Myxococcaceae bacterium]|nr:response regulator [Myxococcaceae bacterium]